MAVVDLNPSQFRLLLAGPKVSRLLPFVTSRGYIADGCLSGSDALDLMRQEARHVLLVELELEDMLLADLLQTVRRENLAGAVILLDDPAKSGMIISQLIRGVDGYVATPPDELYLFRIIERQLLAQWAVAQTAHSEKDREDKQRLEKSVQAERAKVTELVKEIGSLREQLAEMTAAAARSSKRAPENVDTGFALSNEDLADDDDLGELITQRAVRMVAAGSEHQGPPADDRTSPMGWTPPPGLRSAAGGDVGFDDEPYTKPGLEARLDARVPEPAPQGDDDNDLFLDLDDPTTTTETEAMTLQLAKEKAALKKARP